MQGLFQRKPAGTAGVGGHGRGVGVGGAWAAAGPPCAQLLVDPHQSLVRGQRGSGLQALGGITGPPLTAAWTVLSPGAVSCPC